MWDNGRPLKMLKTLRYDLFAMQHIIDVDKYIASNNEGYDLCQMYIPQCAFCNISAENPCAAAYFLGDHYSSVCGIIDSCSVSELPVIQSIIDVDKYLVSETVDYDVCGMYAPFCAVCDKYVKNPCATAYVRYMQMGKADKLSGAANVFFGTKGATVAAAAAAYEHEISVAADSYLYGSAVADDAAGKTITIPVRRSGIKIATLRRRFPADSNN